MTNEINGSKEGTTEERKKKKQEKKKKNRSTKRLTVVQRNIYYNIKYLTVRDLLLNSNVATYKSITPWNNLMKRSRRIRLTAGELIQQPRSYFNFQV